MFMDIHSSQRVGWYRTPHRLHASVLHVYLQESVGDGLGAGRGVKETDWSIHPPRHRSSLQPSRSFRIVCRYNTARAMVFCRTNTAVGPTTQGHNERPEARRTKRSRLRCAQHYWRAEIVHDDNDGAQRHRDNRTVNEIVERVEVSSDAMKPIATAQRVRVSSGP
jgi:hypothetical protein